MGARPSFARRCAVLSLLLCSWSTASGATPTWVKLAPAGAFPDENTNAFAADASGDLIFFGGCGPSGCNTSTGVWRLSDAYGVAGTTAWTQLSTAGGPPAGRHSHAILYDSGPGDNALFIFGGCEGGCFPTGTDAWLLSNGNGRDPMTPTWTALSTNTFPNSPFVQGGLFALDAANGRVIIFGGQDGGGFVCNEISPGVEVLPLESSPLAWTSLSPSGGPPPGQYFPHGGYDPASNRLVAFGGNGCSGISNAVWVLDGANGLPPGTQRWTQLLPEGAPGAPPPLGSVATYSPVANTLFVLQFRAHAAPDFWRLTNASGFDSSGAAATPMWSSVAPTGGPANASPFGIAYDAASDRLSVPLAILSDDQSHVVSTEVWILMGVTAAPNLPPVAITGPDQVLECSGAGSQPALVRADGSFDPDGDALTYQWFDDANHLVATIADPTVSVPFGKHPFSVVVDDGRGATGTASTNVTVQDTTPPSITCPAPVSAECTGSQQASATPGAAFASDICSAVTITGPSGAASYPLGRTELTFSAMDRSGNSSSCQSSVTVVDTTAPTITCPAPITAECTGNEAASVTSGAASASDVCGPVTVSGPAGRAEYPLGTVTLNYFATDESGNTSTCSSSIRVQDTTPPTISCPAPVTAECTGSASARVATGAPTASDVCSAVTVSGPSGAASYPLGTTALTFSASDRTGNASSCQSSVTVVDTTPPTISCPPPVVVECTADASAFVVPEAALAGDVCTPVRVTEPRAGPYPLGTTMVSYSATDQSGNASSCSSSITVADTTPPAFDPSSLADRTVVGGCTSQPVAFEPPAAGDACTQVRVVCGSVAGNSFGANTVTCMATDASGNVSTVTLRVNVLEPLQIVFDPPLVGAGVNNLFRPGQAIPHKVQLFDCGSADVTASAPVEVKLFVSRGANGGGTDLINDMDDFVGIGDVDGRMILVEGAYRFNLKTNTADYPGGGQVFLSHVTAYYTSAPALLAGAGDARLVSR